VIEGCQTAGIGCIDCKQLLFNHLDAFLKPIRERYNNLMTQPDKIREILHAGAKKAQTEANKTLAEVYNRIGFRY